jgi:hypothetical protein
MTKGQDRDAIYVKRQPYEDWQNQEAEHGKRDENAGEPDQASAQAQT